MCTDRVRATFDVQVESDIAAAGIIVGFYDESRECGVANVTGRILIAGVTASLEAATVFLSWEANEGIGSTPQLIQPCQLPATTTRSWCRSGRTGAALAREFEQTYTFTEP